MNSINGFLNTQYCFRKSLDTTDTLLLLTHYLQYFIDKRDESRIVSLDISLLHKLKSVGIGRPVLMYCTLRFIK